MYCVGFAYHVAYIVTLADFLPPTCLLLYENLQYFNIGPTQQ